MKFLYIWISLLVFLALAVYTFWLGFNPTSPVLPIGNEQIGLSRKEMIKLLSLIWLIGPPLLMYIHWGIFCRRYDLSISNWCNTLILYYVVSGWRSWVQCLFCSVGERYYRPSA